MPNHLLQWHAIQWAKKHGCKRYDLWGIPDDATTGTDQNGQNKDKADGMWGVYRFKQGFGGTNTRTVGTYDYVLRPLYYWIGTRAWPVFRSFAQRMRTR